MTFRDLPQGQKFEFVASSLFPGGGIERGPWVKTGARAYTAADHLHRLYRLDVRVGTVYAIVEALAD